jgi:hypothetical protein
LQQLTFRHFEASADQSLERDTFVFSHYGYNLPTRFWNASRFRSSVKGFEITGSLAIGIWGELRGHDEVVRYFGNEEPAGCSGDNYGNKADAKSRTITVNTSSEKTPAPQSGTFHIGGDLRPHHLGFGVMRP